MAIVIDNFLDEDECARLLGALPCLDDGEARKLPVLDVPLELERRIGTALQDPSRIGCKVPADEALPLQADEPTVPFVARLARGSVPMHQDCFSPFDAAETGFIDGYVAVLYLAGAGSFVVDAGDGEQAFDVMPRRFIAWPNGTCRHRLDAAPEGGVRAMLGPVAVDADGLMQRAHDVWSTHPGYIGHCKTAAAEAVAAGDYEGARKHLSNIGIPKVAFEELDKLEEKLKKKLCLTLTLAKSSSGFLLTGTSMSGESLVTQEIEDPAAIKFGQVARSMRQAFTDAAPVFVLPDATVLGEAHHETSLQELFGAPTGAGAGSSEGPAP